MASFSNLAGKYGDVKGLPEILKKLKDLPEVLKSRILSRAMRKGADLIREMAARMVPVRTGQLRNSILVRQPSFRMRTNITLNISADSRIAHLVEFGTSAHPIAPRPMYQRVGDAIKRGYRTAEGQRPAMMIGGRFVAGTVAHPGARPRPFMRPAFDQHADSVIAMVAHEVGKALDKVASGVGGKTWQGVI